MAAEDRDQHEQNHATQEHKPHRELDCSLPVVVGQSSAQGPKSTTQEAVLRAKSYRQMQSIQNAKWYHRNRYSADSACDHCGGIIRHERWCACENAAISYAFRAVIAPAELNEEDQIALHALGVAWS